MFKIIVLLLSIIFVGCGAETRPESAALFLQPNQIRTIEQAPSMFAKSCTVIITDSKAKPILITECQAVTGAAVISGIVSTVGTVGSILGGTALFTGSTAKVNVTQ